MTEIIDIVAREVWTHAETQQWKWMFFWTRAFTDERLSPAAPRRET